MGWRGHGAGVRLYGSGPGLHGYDIETIVQVLSRHLI